MTAQEKRPIISVGISTDLVDSIEKADNQSMVINEAINLYRDQVCDKCFGFGVNGGMNSEPINPGSIAKRKKRFAKQITALISPDNYKWLKNNFPNQGDVIRLSLTRYYNGECVHCEGSGFRRK